MVVNLLLCLIYKLNFIVDMYVWEKHNTYRLWYVLQFAVSPLEKRGLLEERTVIVC